MIVIASMIMMTQKTRRVAIKVAVVLAALAVVYTGLSVYAAMSSMPAERRPVPEPPGGIIYKDVSFPVGDLTLYGWYFPGGEHGIVVVNGGAWPRVDPEANTIGLTRDLVGAGFSVLLFDMRGRGESDGKALTMVHASKDIGAAVEFMKSRHENVSIIGFSLGAAATLIFAKDADVTAVVSDSSFAYAGKAFVDEAVTKTAWPHWIVECVASGTFIAAKLIYGYEKINPIDVVADINCPVLFIHGEADNRIPASDSEKLCLASTDPRSEVWIVPGAEHCQGYNTSPLYVDNVASFLRGVEQHMDGDE
jgi:pimeloyl-ACP methyl ester carboxylesterase